MTYFRSKDLELIEALVYNPNLAPSYDFIRDCLVWNDERTDGLSSEGYERLGDLWIIRSYLHRKVSASEWGLDPNYFQQAWSEATKQNFKWPGFLRLKLSKIDEEYYMQKRYKAFEAENF
jgi:hypothetical protein